MVEFSGSLTPRDILRAQVDIALVFTGPRDCLVFFPQLVSLPDSENKSTECPVKFSFHINNMSEMY